MNHILQNRPGSDLHGLVRVWPNAFGLEASWCADFIWQVFCRTPPVHYQFPTFPLGPLPVSHFPTRSTTSFPLSHSVHYQFPTFPLGPLPVSHFHTRSTTSFPLSHSVHYLFPTFTLGPLPVSYFPTRSTTSFPLSHSVHYQFPTFPLGPLPVSHFHTRSTTSFPLSHSVHYQFPTFPLGPLPVSHFHTRFPSSTYVLLDTVQNQPGYDLVLAECVRFWPNRSGPEPSRCAQIIRPASGQCFAANPDQMQIGSGMFTGYTQW